MSVQTLDNNAYAALPQEMFVIGTDDSHAEDIPRPSTTYWHDVRQRFRRDKLAVAGLVVIVIIGLVVQYGILNPIEKNTVVKWGMRK